LIVVQDDGVGRPVLAKQQKVGSNNSFGTAATMQRIMLNDPRSTVRIDDLYGESGQPAGTKVTIFLYLNSF